MGRRKGERKAALSRRGFRGYDRLEIVTLALETIDAEPVPRNGPLPGSARIVGGFPRRNWSRAAADLLNQRLPEAYVATDRDESHVRNQEFPDTQRIPDVLVGREPDAAGRQIHHRETSSALPQSSQSSCR